MNENDRIRQEIDDVERAVKGAVIDVDAVVDAVEADDNRGFCLACGEEAYYVEPDARRYECEACGERQVYGASEILMAGLW